MLLTQVKRKKTAAGLIFGLLFIIFSGAVLHWRALLFSTSFPTWPQEHEQNLLDSINRPSYTPHKRYEFLFRYFITGFVKALGKNHSHAWYDGAMSGYSSDSQQLQAMEAFTRMAPVIAAWIAGGRAQEIRTLDGKRVDLLELLRNGIESGTSPENPEYWGDIEDFDLRIVEASDLAIALWMLRDTLWPLLDQNSKDKIIDWLQGVNNKNVVENNWLLFPVVVNLVSKKLSGRLDEKWTTDQYEMFSQFYAGDGWYSDGPEGIYDYYNAWGIHYSLFWVRQIDPTFDPLLIERSNKFFETYRYLLGPSGFPIMGRSACYRIAAPVPALIHYLDGESIDPGLARNYFDATWRYFIDKGSLQNGTVTQGYCGTDLTMLDLYSGPGSCLWSLRSLALALLISSDDPFWKAKKKPLPVEVESYTVKIPAIGWTISGNSESREIRLLRDGYEKEAVIIEKYSLLLKFKALLQNRNRRPANKEWKYGLKQYSSVSEICR